MHRAARAVISSSSNNLFTYTRRNKTVALIPADGIGKEVVPAAVRVIDAALQGSKLNYVQLEAGFETFQQTGTSLPQKTLDTLRNECHGALFGAVGSPSHKVAGYSSPIVKMRNELDLYANLRPVTSVGLNPQLIKHVRENVDMLIVRENTECLYVKKEKLDEAGTRAVAERVITKYASERIAHIAFQQARERREQRGSSTKKALVTIVHKSNVLSVTDGLFRETCLEVAKQYPDIAYEEQLVDSMAYKMVYQPHYYDVVVAPNLYGDILSDLAAAFVGGLGLVPSANVNEKFVFCEPVHGSAPDIAGKGIANPIATVRAAAMLLKHLADSKDASDPFTKAGNAIDAAVNRTLQDSANFTPDLGGNSTTDKVTEAILRNL